MLLISWPALLPPRRRPPSACWHHKTRVAVACCALPPPLRRRRWAAAARSAGIVALRGLEIAVLPAFHLLEVAASAPAAGMGGLRGLCVLGAQLAALTFTLVTACWSCFTHVPIAVATACLRSLLPGCDGRCDGKAQFYEVRAPQWRPGPNCARVEDSARAGGLAHSLPRPTASPPPACLSLPRRAL